MTAMNVMGELNGRTVMALLNRELKDYYEWQAHEAKDRGLMTAAKKSVD